jgi:translation initiation factor 2B subunit (eIF-2B alpha/beta/delta family)
MSEPLEGEVNNQEPPDGMDQLNQCTKAVQDLSDTVKRLYIEAKTIEQVDAIDQLSSSVQQLQFSLGNAITVVLKGTSTALGNYTADLNSVLSKLQDVVAVLNQINTILDAATQIAQIAAGVAKM